MKNKKDNKKTKVNYNKIKRYLKGFSLLGATIISMLYILYIILISMYNYLYNRPIRTAFLMVFISVLMLVIDSIEERKKNKRYKQTSKQVNSYNR